VEWSYRLLAPELQRIFRRLSVFRGGWTAEAAEAVCEAGAPEGAGPGSGRALEYLEQLRECSLVQVEETELGMRFRMLETLREYAAERLAASGEEAVCRKRHADCYLALAEEAEPQLDGPEQAVWLERLEREHDNLRAVFQYSLEGSRRKAEEEDNPLSSRGHDLSTALKLGGALVRFWEMHGHLSEGRTLLAAALSREEGQARTKVRATALNVAGRLAFYQGDYTQAQVYHEESLSIGREIGDRQRIAASLINLGLVAHEQGDYTAARTFLEESLSIGREIGDKQRIGASLNNLARVAGAQGDYTLARSLHEESLAIDRELGDKQGIAGSLNNLGLLACDQGDYTQARAYHEESLSIKQEIGDKMGIAWSLHNLGLVAHTQCDYTAARTFLEECLSVFREIGDKVGIAWSLHNLGNTVVDLGDHGAARDYLEESLSIIREIGNRWGIANSLIALGRMAVERGDYAQARACLSECVQIVQELGDRPTACRALETWAGLAAAEAGSKIERAARLWGAAERLREAIGSPLPPSIRKEYDRLVTETRNALGEKAFASAWEAGCAMTWEEAVAYALEDGRA
jgi:tetratricopeptide (TPR) repeat protein